MNQMRLRLLTPLVLLGLQTLATACNRRDESTPTGSVTAPASSVVDEANRRDWRRAYFLCGPPGDPTCIVEPWVRADIRADCDERGLACVEQPGAWCRGYFDKEIYAGNPFSGSRVTCYADETSCLRSYTQLPGDELLAPCTVVLASELAQYNTFGFTKPDAGTEPPKPGDYHCFLQRTPAGSWETCEPSYWECEYDRGFNRRARSAEEQPPPCRKADTIWCYRYPLGLESEPWGEVCYGTIEDCEQERRRSATAEENTPCEKLSRAQD